MKAVITTIYDRKTNPWYGRHFCRGLSLHIKLGSQQMLMDFGMIGPILVNNMKLLKINPDKITKGLVSHGHADHIWGLKSFLNHRNSTKKLPLYLHETALEPKRAFCKSIRLWNAGYAKLNETQGKKIKFIFNKEPTKITSLISTTGEIPLSERKAPQCISKHFMRYSKGQWIFDHVLDDQSFVLKTLNGLVILTGDCHSGIVNVVDKVKELYNDDIVAIVGSLHLMEIPKEKLKNIVDLLKNRLEQTEFYLNHTISKLAWETLRKQFGEDRIIHFRMGKNIIFDC